MHYEKKARKMQCSDGKPATFCIHVDDTFTCTTILNIAEDPFLSLHGKRSLRAVAPFE